MNDEDYREEEHALERHEAELLDDAAGREMFDDLCRPDRSDEGYSSEPLELCYACDIPIWLEDDGIKVEFETLTGYKRTVMVCSDECREKVGH